MIKKANLEKVIWVFSISLFMSFGLIQDSVLADDYYVDASLGADDPSHGGSPGSGAWKTVTYALSQGSGSSENPATLHISAGTYDTSLGESFPLNMKDYVSLQGAGYDVTIIDADQAQGVIKSEQKNDYTIDGFTITGGRALRGGGIFLSYSSPIVRNCTITGNTATDLNGGGIYCKQSSPTLTNCVISGNSAPNQNGGGISCSDHSSPTITNCTIVGNEADDGYEEGGGALSIGNLSSPTVTNCILWDNYPDEINVKDAPAPSVIYSCVEGGYTGEGNSSSDPQFVGSTNYHLAYNSPCIDSANSTGVPLTDIEGNERYDALTTNNSGTGPFAYYDRGAYEYQGDTDGDGIKDDGDNNGIVGDHPCTGGATENCDDNCVYIPNPEQQNFDGDEQGDVCDPDDDNDGIPDAVEGGGDPDNDGLPNWFDTDSDGDGIGDTEEAGANPNNPVDTDGDGNPDFLDLDSDDDTILDGIDNCQLIPNTNQADADNDGKGDVCDVCPNDPENDGDGDGFCSDEDNCPNESNPNQEDNDTDGVGNVCDNCLEHPNGSSLGTCVKTEYGVTHSYRVGDPKQFITCDGNEDCTPTGGTCQMTPEDFNGNGCGDVCECYADCTGTEGIPDGKVSTPDYSQLKLEFGRFHCSPQNPCLADFNNDGKVTTPDYSLLKQEFGRFDCPACQ